MRAGGAASRGSKPNPRLSMKTRSPEGSKDTPRGVFQGDHNHRKNQALPKKDQIPTTMWIHLSGRTRPAFPEGSAIPLLRCVCKDVKPTTQRPSTQVFHGSGACARKTVQVVFRRNNNSTRRGRWVGVASHEGTPSKNLIKQGYWLFKERSEK